MLVWAVNLPIMIFAVFGVLRDNLRYVCIPIMIATAIFLVIITVLSGITIVHSIIAPNHWLF